jgi:hypothetical protein
MPQVLQAEVPAIKPWFKQAVLLKSYQQSFDWLTPWEKLEIRTQTGMALVVRLPLTKNSETAETLQNQGLHLLTTAEMVADATLLEVTRKDIRQPFQAKLVLMDYAANLALLNIEDSNFWVGLNPIEWSPVKSKSKADTENIYSFKIKSTQEWEVELGTIQLMTVGHRGVSDAWLPLLKLSGISKSGQGFPLLQDNETVGMILEAGKDGAKAIPTQMLIEFLAHAGSASYKSLAHRGFSWRRLPQRSTADYFQIPQELPGIWISQILPYGTGSGVLQRGDYLTKIGKWPLSHDGKIQHPEWGLSLFDLLFLDQLKVGDSLELELIRDGKPLVLQTRVSAYEEDGRTVPLKRVGHPPRYVIQGGFLFQELTLNYLSMWGSNWRSRAPVRLRLFLEQNKTVLIDDNFKRVKGESASKNTEPSTRIVLVTQVIPDEINIGYQKLSNAIVLRINGQQIRRLKDVSEAFLNPEIEFHRIDFLPGSDRLSVVLPVAGLKQSNLRIKNNFRIPKLQSY